MTVHPNDVFRMIGDIEDAARKQLAKCQEVRMMLATFDLPKPSPGFVCQEPTCGVSRRTQALLDEHLENVHGRLIDLHDRAIEEAA